MDEAQRSELRELRRRAYGPAPDLDDAELDRLRALEARQPRQAGADAGASAPVPAAAPDVPSAADRPDHVPEEADPDDRARPASPRRRRTAILWAASVLVAVGATVALTTGLASMTGRDVGTVALDPDRPVPTAGTTGTRTSRRASATSTASR
ncbi:hypothetical protein [Clavibacter capsici]|uniref:hypothetical protein n=1 Tax=Clavibacter capsici TaxID=1874630 RepID=UPI00287B6BD9|nr:hypothetical protein [Clavibacter capsici]